MSIRLPLTLALAATLSVSTALAQTSPSAASNAPLSQSLTGMARAEYEAGKILYADGDFAGAALKFQRAYDESKDPRLLWNMAAAEKNLRHYGRVYTLIERYLAEAGSRLGADDKAEAQALLDTVKGFIGEVTIGVNQAGATISIDDQAIGTSPLPGPIRVEMGERKIRVTKPGFVEFATTQSIPGGTATRIDVTLQAEVHEGRLRVVAAPGDSIRVDGRALGTGQWEGTLPSGIHNLEVSAPGKRTYQSDVGVQDGQTATLRVTLEAEAAAIPPGASEKGAPAWPWVVGGVVLAGLGVGAYFLFKPEDESAPPPVDGTLDPGSIPLFVRF